MFGALGRGSNAACVVAALVSVAAVGRAVAGPPAAWSPRGPGGGGAMYSPTINPLNPDELYVACDMSPQFHTTDLGKSWSVVDFRQLQSSHESAVRFTRDPKIRWALDYTSPGGGDAVRPVRSTDGGVTWQRPTEAAWPVSRVAYMLYADFANPDRAVLTAEYRELWVTLDGGRSFARKATGLGRDAGLHLAGVFFDGDSIYAGTNDGVYVSRDGGQSFALAAFTGLPAGGFMSSFAGAEGGGRTRLLCVIQKDGWAGITGGDCQGFAGIYVLDVGQDAWVKKVNGLSETARPFFVKMAGDDPNTAYAAGGNGYPVSGPSVFKTTDGGNTWSDVFRFEGNANIIPGWAGDGGVFRWSFPEYALGFEVCPTDSERLVLTDLGCAHLSTDGGQTWRQVYATLAEPRAPGAAIPAGARYASCGMDMTSVWGIAWFDENTLFGCNTDIKGARSTDGGGTWSFGYTGHNLNTMYGAVKHPTTGVCYAATSSVHDLYMSTYLADNRIDAGKGLVLSSADNGASWVTLKDLGKPVVWVALDPTNPRRLYAAVVSSEVGGLYVTDELDKGPDAAWRKLSAPPRTEGHPYNLRVLNDGTLVCSYAGRRVGNGFTASSGVFVSSDGGQTWEDRSDPGMRYWTKDVVIDPNDAAQNTWYAGVFFAWGQTAQTGKSGLYRTRDRGRTWQLLADSSLSPTGVLNVDSCTVNPRDPNELYFTTEYDGLWVTADLKAERPTFKQVQSYRFKHPLRVQFNPYRPSEMWVTSFGNGVSVGEMTGD
jgi:photosystem II stability/assembly factor-like uncharacterized protein